jgi:hypothetical protein
LTFSYFFDEELHFIKPNCSTEEAYDYLSKEINDKSDNSNSSDDDSKKYDVTSSDGLIEINDKRNNKKYNVITSDIIGNQDPLDNSNDSINEILDSMFNEAKISYESMNDNYKGNISGNFKSIFSTLFEQPVPWEDILLKSIKTNIQLVPDSRSWATPNKKYRCHNIILPSEINIEKNNAIGLLIILIDTSGSISDDDLQKFTSVIIQSFNHFEEILLILHDYHIKQIKNFKNNEVDEFKNYIKIEGYAGRGGTSHKEAFSYIEENIWKNRLERDKLSMIISLTDAYSDIDNTIIIYKWFINKTPITFLITPNGNADNIRLDTNYFKNISKINMSDSNKQKKI